MRLSSTMSGGSSLVYVGVIPVTFSVFGGKKLHQFLILSDNLLYNFCTSCWNWWCRIFGWIVVHHILLVLKFWGKVAYDLFNKIFLPVAILFEGQLSGISEFLMGFVKFCFECNPIFLDRRKTIPLLDRLSEFSCLVEDVIRLGDGLRLWIGTPWHIPVLEKVFNIIENVFNWIDGVEMHLCHFFFEIVHMNRWYFSIRCENVRENQTCVSCKLSCSSILCWYNVWLFDGCDNLLNKCWLNSTYFMGKTDILVIHLLKFV